MGTKACNILCQEDEEDYLDYPVTLLDLEEHSVLRSSENYFRHITIEDPGYVVDISLEDYEIQLQKSLSQVKELKRESSGYTNNIGNLLSKCRTCSIKLVDYRKFPYYYRSKLQTTNNTQYPKTDHKVIEIGDEKDREEVMFIDLTKEEHVEYNNVSKEEIVKVKADWNKFTGIDNAVGGKVRKQTYKTSTSKPVLNLQKETHTELPSKETVHDPDLIFKIYSRTIDTTIQKIKNNIESSQNNTNISHNFGNELLLESKSFIKNHANNSQDIKENDNVAKVQRDNINKGFENVRHKKKNTKNSNEVTSIYTSEQISKTKLKIKKTSLKSKECKNYYKEMEDTRQNLNTTNKKQYDSLKMIEKKRKSTNEVPHIHYSYPLISPNFESNRFSSLPRNTDFDRTHECYKQLFIADRIIPHFHKNIYLNHPKILSKSSTRCPKGTKETIYKTTTTKETIHNYETKKNKRHLTSMIDLNKMSQISNPSFHDTYHCTENNNAMFYDNKPQKQIYNTMVSNNSAIDSQNSSPFTYKLPVNNALILNLSHASPEVIIENVNNIVSRSQCNKHAAQLEKERLLYLLPSNCNLPDSHIQNIFSYNSDSNSQPLI